VSIDFYDTQNPEIERFDLDFEEHGYCLCITDTKGSHANLTDDYVAIRSEMESVAAYFGKQYLREVSEIAFYDAIPKLRETCPDRVILRASHFFSENSRALQEAETLKSGDLDEFLRLVNESGESSAQLLQNLYSTSKPTQQEIPLAIMMSKRVLNGTGAVRVHGGGFAGTIQAFVPLELADRYTEEMNRIFGDGSCQKLRIRPVGGIEIKKEEA
ncbi:MAG: galactokinase, partial [Oscillospiraceae bacterium]|nr:galactokinase [Oscillospiraceae bacterium]